MEIRRAERKQADAEVRASIDEGEAGIAGPGRFWDEAHSRDSFLSLMNR